MTKRQARRLRRKIKNGILITINYIMGFVLMFSACAIDTEGTNLFYITFLVSLAWLALMAKINGYME